MREKSSKTHKTEFELNLSNDIKYLIEDIVLAVSFITNCMSKCRSVFLMMRFIVQNKEPHNMHLVEEFVMNKTLIFMLLNFWLENYEQMITR